MKFRKIRLLPLNFAAHYNQWEEDLDHFPIVIHEYLSYP